MSKYVYNFEEMNKLSKTIHTECDNFQDNINKYQNQISNALTDCNSPSMDQFFINYNGRITNIFNYINNMESLAGFIDTTSNVISEAEEELSKLNIM